MITANFVAQPFNLHIFYLFIYLFRLLNLGCLCHHVAGGMGHCAHLRALCDLPCGLRSGGRGLSPGVVHPGASQTPTRREGYRRASRGPETRGAGGPRQHASPQSEGQTGVHPPGGTGKEPA